MGVTDGVNTTVSLTDENSPSFCEVLKVSEESTGVSLLVSSTDMVAESGIIGVGGAFMKDEAFGTVFKYTVKTETRF